MELDLADLPSAHRAQVLESLLRRDEIFLRQGKDVARWASSYEARKSKWLVTVEAIIEDACEAGVLKRDSRGRFLDPDSAKEKFLLSLDRRHFDSLSGKEKRALGFNLVQLFIGGISRLPAIRLNSLCFWYAYVNVDQSSLIGRKGSDMGDLVQLMMLPYCDFFTVDNAMFRLLARVRADLEYSCRVLNRADFERLLGIAK